MPQNVQYAQQDRGYFEWRRNGQIALRLHRLNSEKNRFLKYFYRDKDIYLKYWDSGLNIWGHNKARMEL